mmetsp:Transcript_26374/g.55811  ORF Transcript_26374/g.55811 Transcript_26374/m.55811 type:complete len:283 (+) Transcript_26374:10-858(+)
MLIHLEARLFLVKAACLSAAEGKQLAKSMILKSLLSSSLQPSLLPLRLETCRDSSSRRGESLYHHHHHHHRRWWRLRLRLRFRLLCLLSSHPRSDRWPRSFSRSLSFPFRPTFPLPFPLPLPSPPVSCAREEPSPAAALAMPSGRASPLPKSSGTRPRTPSRQRASLACFFTSLSGSSAASRFTVSSCPSTAASSRAPRQSTTWRRTPGSWLAKSGPTAQATSLPPIRVRACTMFVRAAGSHRPNTSAQNGAAAGPIFFRALEAAVGTCQSESSRSSANAPA